MELWKALERTDGIDTPEGQRVGLPPRGKDVWEWDQKSWSLALPSRWKEPEARSSKASFRSTAR